MAHLLKLLLGLNIGVLVVIDQLQSLKNYDLAQDTVTCYCRKFKYKLIRIAMDRNPELRKKCPQKDFMFQRHCVTINVLRDNPELEYILFLDADMGIINPNHLIEEYINPKFDILFYERIFNFEVMAGSYIVKNTPYSITFLKDWIEYENKLPDSFHGTDNAAIHQILVDWYNPNDKRDLKCRLIWEESK
uniref:Nucleotide-diphospho-sugar transferase domain-containing protein n=1 Tax=Panagrolaimus sp. PS1159 TaxID=55785 RepID=A0AC35G022_9BILA